MVSCVCVGHVGNVSAPSAASPRQLSLVNYPLSLPRSGRGRGPSLLILTAARGPGPLSCCCGVVEPRLLLAHCCCDPQHSDLRISVECHLPDPLQGSMA